MATMTFRGRRYESVPGDCNDCPLSDWRVCEDSWDVSPCQPEERWHDMGPVEDTYATHDEAELDRRAMTPRQRGLMIAALGLAALAAGVWLWRAGL